MIFLLYFNPQTKAEVLANVEVELIVEMRAELKAEVAADMAEELSKVCGSRIFSCCFLIRRQKQKWQQMWKWN